jgi:hypothetical protein
MLTVASLNARGFPLAGSQVAERYGVIGAGFDAGDAGVVCCQEVLTCWQLRLLARAMRSSGQGSGRGRRAPCRPLGPPALPGSRRVTLVTPASYVHLFAYQYDRSRNLRGRFGLWGGFRGL